MFNAIRKLMFPQPTLPAKPIVGKTAVPSKPVIVVPNYTLGGGDWGKWELCDHEGQPIDNSNLAPGQPPRGGVLMEKK